MRSGGRPGTTAANGQRADRVVGAPAARVRLPGSSWGSPLRREVPRGRHGFPLDQVSTFQRVRLLDAFVAEVAERGFPGTRVAQVCTIAGASTKAFYAAFGTKDDCLLHAFDVGAGILCHHAAIAFRRRDGSLPDRVGAAVDTMLAILAANPPFTRVALLEVPRLGPAGGDRFDMALERFRAGVGLGPTGPRTTTDPGDSLSVLLGGALRLLAGYVVAGRTDKLAEAAPQLVRWAAVWTAARDEREVAAPGRPASRAGRIG